jgi:hypothetical protein
MARVHLATIPAWSRPLGAPIAVSLLCLSVAGADGVRGDAEPTRRTRPIRLVDVEAGLCDRLPRQATSREGFAEWIRSIEEATAARETAGEYEHLVYYMLQSKRFTDEPAIEPALSALEMVRGLAAERRAAFLEERDRALPQGPDLPPAVRRRAADLVRAVHADRGDVRLAHFRRLMAADGAAAAPAVDRLLEAYARTMRFLYRKEFASRGLKDPQELEAYLASLYQRRGHSTDTEVEANFAVHTALAVVRAYGQRRLDRVLVVGPGLDFAPRTDFLDVFEPQSYQPFAVADALIGLQLSDARALRLHCVDINARVLDYLGGLSSREPTRLALLPGVPERPDRPFTPEFRAYFRGLGTEIGQEAPLALPPGMPPRPGKALHVRPEIAARITAGRLNVVTERYDPSPEYDLVVVTNVFSYFEPAEQVLALSNIAAMLRDGGYMIHNEPQSSLIDAAAGVGLPLADARSVLLAAHETAPLFDRIVIHRKSARKGGQGPLGRAMREE